MSGPTSTVGPVPTPNLSPTVGRSPTPGFDLVPGSRLDGGGVLRLGRVGGGRWRFVVLVGGAGGVWGGRAGGAQQGLSGAGALREAHRGACEPLGQEAVGRDVEEFAVCVDDHSGRREQGVAGAAGTGGALAALEHAQAPGEAVSGPRL
ncbi:hypothetical protein [Kineosporia sp. NBRC 101677]|uniref:hypothetical protein n=1 Tax=Kineosporia sp. NBRC 101677 TaxID=3032197 RepID=UPI00255552AB|nr:hypothetical protein [Kineosporia sp. NBRC 101677]